jgi:hypothetical protein
MRNIRPIGSFSVITSLRSVLIACVSIVGGVYHLHRYRFSTGLQSGVRLRWVGVKGLTKRPGLLD